MGEDATAQNQTFLDFSDKFFWFKSHENVAEINLNYSIVCHEHLCATVTLWTFNTVKTRSYQRLRQHPGLHKHKIGLIYVISNAKNSWIYKFMFWALKDLHMEHKKKYFL